MWNYALFIYLIKVNTFEDIVGKNTDLKKMYKKEIITLRNVLKERV